MSTSSQPVLFTSGEKTIAIIIGIAASISVFSILVLLARFAFAAIRPITQGLKGRKDSKEALFFQTQLGAYVACLLLANLMSGLAGLLEFSWAGLGQISSGPECTVQGSLIQIGDFASAYFTAAIAVHTFQTLVLHKRSPVWVVVLIVAFGWGSAVALGTALTTISTSFHGPFFDSVGTWCAISSGYTVEQFAVYYLPIILSALVTASLYAIIYLCLRGTLVIGDGIKLNLSPENVQGWAGRLNGREEYRHFLGSIIRSLLWFPFAFIVLFIPVTISGLMRISGITNSDALLAVAGVTASLNGFANVLILYNTMRVLRPAISSNAQSMGSESFFVEERKQSPIEAPKPMIFEEKPIAAPSPRMHGRAFPPPVSRVGSPMSSTGSGYGLPATPRSAGRAPPPARRSADLLREQTVTPQMKEMWLKHQRSSSSVDSSTALLRAGSPGRPGHSRNGSTMTSESIHTLVGNPILPSTEINRRVDADIMSPPVRSQTTSPAPAITITRPTTPASAGLPPPPRPHRGESMRESLLDINMKLMGKLSSSSSTSSVPPVPPLPSNRSSESVYTQYTQPDVPSDSKHEDHDFADYRSHTPKTPKTPMTSRSTSHNHSTRTSMSFDHEDFEIHRVDSRDRLRPAISAVAHSPAPSTSSKGVPFPAKNAMASAVSLPESVSGASLVTGESEDSMHAEIRSRASTMDNPEGQLSSIAWASLVTHAVPRLAGEISRQSSEESDEETSWGDGREDDSEVTPPESAGASMYFRFDSLGSSSQPQRVDSTLSVSRPAPLPSRTPTPTSQMRQMRSFNGVGTSAQSGRSDNRPLGRSETRITRNTERPGYI